MYRIKLVGVDNLFTDKWENLPNIYIQYLDFILPNNKTIRLSGFESYLFFKEIYSFPFQTNKSTYIDTVNILVKFKNEVIQLSYNVQKNYFAQTKNEWGKEFTPLIWNAEKNRWDKGKARTTNKSLWKDGFINNPTIKII